MARPFGEVSYTLKNLLVAPYNIVANTYGTPVSVADGQMLVSEPEADTDKMRGYGVYSRGLAVPIGAALTFKAGGLDIEALKIVAGATVSTTGTTPNQVKKLTLPAGGAGLPYFGVLGVSATDDGGVAVIGLQAVKLDTVPRYEANGEENKFNVWETAGYAFPQGGILETIKLYETAAGFDAPGTGAEFLAWFT